MKYRQLGRTRLNVSVIGVGTWQFGGEWGKDFSQPEVDRLLGRARDLGINFIDTAECYGDHLSESLVGGATQGQRDQWIIGTKFGHKFPRPYERLQRWSPDEVRQQLEESLRALRTDYIDLYQFHSGSDEAFEQDELWTMLHEQRAAGKIRHFGISIKGTNLHQTQRAVEVGAGAIQVIYNRLNQAPEDEIFPVCEADNLGVLARVPLASGYLSGKYQPGTRFTDETDRRHRQAQEKIDQTLAQVQAIRETEVPNGVDMAAWSLAWCLRHPAVTCVIPGCKTVAHVEANASAAELVAAGHPQALEMEQSE